MIKEIVYSEIFHSLQGEGKYTGTATAWLRFFLCNLQCDGFGQKNPKDPATYILPYQDVDVKEIQKLEDIPVFKHGCDSSYSWSKKFRHLQHKGYPVEIVKRIRESMYHPANPRGNFNYILQNNSIIHQHMCFTGGEPLMNHAQNAAIDIIDQMVDQGDFPLYITWETNGTQQLTPKFMEYFVMYPGEKFFSVSPKLLSVSGELTDKAIKPDVVAQYQDIVNSDGQLKFVINGTQESWDELEETVAKFRQAGVRYPVWVMSVGATLEAQKGVLDGYTSEAKIATETFKRGYNYSSRVHVHIFGNTMGT